MSSEFVTVAVFSDTVEAALARNRLEENGIRAFFLDEMTVGVDWALSQAVGGIKLQVHQANAHRADALLRQHPTAPGDDASADGAFATPATVAELNADLHAEAEDNAPKNQAVDRLYRTTVGGLLFVPFQFYALWLLMSLNLVEGTVSRKRRWKVWASVLLNVPLLSVCLVPVGCLASRYGGEWQGPAWKKRDFPDEGFSVRLPGKPEFEVGHFATRYGEVECAVHFAPVKDVNFQVSVFRYPKAVRAVDSAKLLDEEVPEIIASWGVRVLEHREAETGVKEWSLESHRTFIRARFFVSENRIYAVLAEWPTGTTTPPQVTAFLNSFTLR